MAWIITRDYIAAAGSPAGTNHNAVGKKGGTFKSSRKYAFRMYDDDGMCYYEGFSDSKDDDAAFAPLDAFGGPNAGCSYIQYRVKGKWETL